MSDFKEAIGFAKSVMLNPDCYPDGQAIELRKKFAAVSKKHGSNTNEWSEPVKKSFASYVLKRAIWWI